MKEIQLSISYVFQVGKEDLDLINPGYYNRKDFTLNQSI